MVTCQVAGRLTLGLWLVGGGTSLSRRLITTLIVRFRPRPHLRVVGWWVAGDVGRISIGLI